MNSLPRFWFWDALVLVALATVLRFHGLGALSLGEEEVGNLLAARSYLESGQLADLVGVEGGIDFLYPWICAGSMEVFGESDRAVRFPAAASGVALALGIYLWGSHWFGPWGGRWAAFLFAVWPWPVAWGRTGTASGFYPLLYFLAVIAFWKAVEKNGLNQPISDPPTIRGPRPHGVRTLLDWAPFWVCLALLFLTDRLAFFSLAMVPFYLLFRLEWGWRRGGLADFQFRRTCWILAVGGCLFAVGVVVWGESASRHLTRVSAASGDSTVPFGWLYFFRDRFGLLFTVGALLGLAGAILKEGRPGWLVFAAAAGPLLAKRAFLPFSPGLDQDTFPFVLIGLAIPLGWASRELEIFYRRCTVALKEPGMVQLGAACFIGAMVWTIHGNVLVAEWGTAAVVRGGAVRVADQVPDWKAIKEWVEPHLEGASLVSTDPALCLYYLGRCDAVYPSERHSGLEKDPLTGTAFLHKPDDLRQRLVLWKRVLLVGTRREFEEASRENQEARRLWTDIKQTNQEIWLGPHEIAIRWEAGGGV